jgi:Ca-activated chloride channel family protein
MRIAALGVVGVLCLVGCGKSAVQAPQEAKSPKVEAKSPALAAVTPVQSPGHEEPANPNAPWIGASAESERILASTTETFVGVWVDVPKAAAAKRAPVDLALVIDTSGSMAGDKIQAARDAATRLVQTLKDGDIVSVDTFNDRAHSLVAPTRIDATSRSRVIGTIAELSPMGQTNMFEGISMGESHIAQAPMTHTVRRIVVISDGQANVGPSSPEALGTLAERSLDLRAQITSLGVGQDYDERTLNTLAMRTSGRLFHVGKSSELASVMEKELGLLNASVASDAFVEVVPAHGVQILGVADGVRVKWGSNGAIRIPLGTLFGGQHREALVRVKVTPGENPGPRSLASVRLFYRDPLEADLDRVQEVVARVESTDDPAKVLAASNARTRSIVAVNDAAKLKMEAAAHVNDGRFDDADKQLAAAEKHLRSGAAAATDR